MRKNGRKVKQNSKKDNRNMRHNVEEKNMKKSRKMKGGREGLDERGKKTEKAEKKKM